VSHVDDLQPWSLPPSDVLWPDLLPVSCSVSEKWFRQAMGVIIEEARGLCPEL